MDAEPTPGIQTLYGTPLSLYTGKARAYLIKQRIPYREITPTTAHFRDQVRPHAGGQSIPILETAEGRVIRDSTAIIDYFENLRGGQSLPKTPWQRFLARLFDVIGSEGLLRPAMHYRWNYPAENLNFLAFHFQSMIPRDRDRVALAEQTMARMRNAGEAFGAVSSTFSLVESLYAEFLRLLNDHLRDVPYLLGAAPTIADYGMMAPMYAHLGRDPKPLALMQANAIHVFRWVERMNRPEPDIGEYALAESDASSVQSGQEADDQLLGTMIALLQHIARDLVPETLAAANLINEWLDEQQPRAMTPIQRGVGMCHFEIDQLGVKALAQPYRFYLLARLQSDYSALSTADQARVMAMANQCHLAPLLAAKLTREIGRVDNREVWM